MPVKDRLIQFLDSKGVSQGKFEKEVGLSNGFVNNIGDSVRRKSLDKITAKYPDLNKTWLLTGEGEMFINKDETSKEDYKDRYIKLLEKENERLSSSVELNLILIRKYSEVLVAWVEAFAGSAPAHLSNNSEEAASWLQDIHKRLVDNLPPHAKGDISVGSLSKDKKLS